MKYKVTILALLLILTSCSLGDFSANLLKEKEFYPSIEISLLDGSIYDLRRDIQSIILGESIKFKNYEIQSTIVLLDKNGEIKQVLPFPFINNQVRIFDYENKKERYEKLLSIREEKEKIEKVEEFRNENNPANEPSTQINDKDEVVFDESESIAIEEPQTPAFIPANKYIYQTPPEVIYVPSEDITPEIEVTEVLTDDEDANNEEISENNIEATTIQNDIDTMPEQTEPVENIQNNDVTKNTLGIKTDITTITPPENNVSDTNPVNSLEESNSNEIIIK